MARLFSLASCFLAMSLCVALARADDPGQEDLDQAMDANPKARTVKDMGDVIRLCEAAKKKGLSKENAKFADSLLASTLYRRGMTVAEALFDAEQAKKDWAQMRNFALADLERTVKLDPRQPEAHLHIARLHLMPGCKPERARQALDQAVAQSGENLKFRSKALLMRSSLTEDLKKRRADLDEAVRIAPEDPSMVLSRGLLLADLGEYEAALADLNKASELNPGNPGVYEARGIILSRLRKFDEALAALDKARELRPKATGPLIEQARIHALRGNNAAALHTLEQAAELDPDDLNAVLLRAAVYQEMGSNDKALADLDRLLKAKPGLAPAVRMRAMMLAGGGKLSAAIEEMEKLRKENPKDSAAAMQLAMFYAADQQFIKAIELYTQSLAAGKDDVFKILRGRGDAYLGIGKHAEAIADFDKAYKLDEKDPGLLNNFAWVLATSPDDKLRDGKRAVTLATAACQLTNFRQAHILSTLAAAFAETGDFKKAIEWSEKSVVLAENEQKVGLRKELASYQASKPWRERQLPTDAKPKKSPPPAKKAAAASDAEKANPKAKPKKTAEKP